jgi:hypothetical protein
MIKHFYLYLLFLSSGSFQCQTLNDVLKKMNNQFMSKSLQFATSYSLYKDHKTSVVHENYKGEFIKNKANEVCMRIKNTDFINNNKFSVKINHDQKALQVFERKKFENEFDVNKFLALCSLKSFTDYKTHWEVIFIPKALTGLNYSQILIQINKNYTLKKQVFYYNYEMNFSKDYTKSEMHMPRLVITFSDYKDTIEEYKINSDLIFTESKSGQLILGQKYKTYELEDKRRKLNKTKK